LCGGVLGIVAILATSPEGYGVLLNTWTIYDLYILISVGAAAGGYLTLRALVRTGMSIEAINGLSMLIGGLLCCLWGLYEGRLPAYVALTDPVFVRAMVLLVLLVNLAGLGLQTKLISYYSPHVMALSSYLTPLLGLAISTIVYGEGWRIYHYGIVVLIMVSTYYAQRVENATLHTQGS
jgi:drug/metabolite transporter (DMT)-like permease